MLALNKFKWFSARKLLVTISVLIMLPVFFQLQGGLFVDPAVYFNSNGQLSLVPIPVSVLVCCFGIVLLGRYGDARVALATIFFQFVGMLLVSLLLGENSKLILLVQFVLPMFALVLGQQCGRFHFSLQCVACSGALVLSVVVPLQLLSTWMAGAQHLMPSVFWFSIYQHFEYVPVVFVGFFLLSLFGLEGRGVSIWLAVLGIVMGIYTVISLSMLAQVFLALGVLGFASRGLWARRPLVPLLTAAVTMTGIAVGVATTASSPFSNYYYSATGEGSGLQAGHTLEIVPLKAFHARQEIWHFYAKEVSHDLNSLLLGHVEAPDRGTYPSAHNYYLDFAYNFGLIGMLPLFVLLVYTFFLVALRFSHVWARRDLLGLTGVVAFFLLVDNFLKVGLRQPYPGILMFFFWGILLTALTSRPKLGSKLEGARTTTPLTAASV